MKRKIALSSRGVICFILFCSINIIGGICCLVFLSTKNIPLRQSIYTIIIFILAADAAAAVFTYYFLVLPYREVKSLYRMFINEQIYQELFESKYDLSPEIGIVLRRFDRLLDKQDAIKMSKRQAEYLALQNQINPHFLYNTLEAIRGDALCDGMVNIAGTAEALATFFRYTITEVENLVTLEDELNNVENYFIIQKYRFGEKMKMEINIPENEINIYQLQLPKLTLQPIVENAIFHGLEGKVDGGTVSINIETTKTKLLLSIVDDGLGMKEEVLDKINNNLNKVAVSYANEDRKHGGIALRNVSSRIKLLFGEEYGVHIFSIPNLGTDVRITLPLITGAEK